MKKLSCIICFFLLSSLMMAQVTGTSLPVKVQNGEELSCSMKDSEGYWWYGGRDTGLCRFDGYETESFRSDRHHPDLLRSNDVLCMAEHRENAEIWFGTKEGAYILNKKDYTIRPVIMRNEQTNELADKRVSCMMTAADGSMWLTYRNQVLHFSAKAELIERFETSWEGKNRSVLEFCFDADCALWTRLWNGGVIRWKKAGGRWQKENRLQKDYPSAPSEPMSAELQKSMLDSVVRKQVIGNDTTILSWATRSDGNIFFGTYHSLYLYQKGSRSSRVQGFQNLSENGCLTLLQGDLDKVRSMAYSEKTHTLYFLSKARGVCQWKDNHLTTILDSTDFRQLYLQGDTALLLLKGVAPVSMLNLRTLHFTADTTTADVCPIITSYVIDGKKQLMLFGQQMLTLPKRADLVEIYLSTLDFDHASKVQFAYSLNDNDEWMELPEGEHVIRIAHTPGGESRLQVRATDAFGRWSKPTTVLTIVCPLAWYEHVWLWVVAGLLVVIGLMSLRSSRGSRVQDSEEQNSSLKKDLPVADQEFIDKAVASVSAHMTDCDYSVDMLASDLSMSRANLHRRMRAITGKTPTDFIRNQRLERAAHLLRTTSHSVNEISDLVGFSYASYFTKCFKEKYGVLPKDYVK